MASLVCVAMLNEVRGVRDALARQQEIIADIGFNAGYHWHSVSEEARGDLIDHLDGSRGLMEKIIDWAREFDAFWEALPENDGRRENYISEVDEFAEQKLKTMIAEIRLGG